LVYSSNWLSLTVGHRSLWMCLPRFINCWWQVGDGGCSQNNEDSCRSYSLCFFMPLPASI